MTEISKTGVRKEYSQGKALCGTGRTGLLSERENDKTLTDEDEEAHLLTSYMLPRFPSSRAISKYPIS